MHRKLYSIARKLNRAATIMNDVNVIASRDPKKIEKRLARKMAYKTAHGGANSIVQKILKWTKW